MNRFLLFLLIVSFFIFQVLPSNVSGQVLIAAPDYPFLSVERVTIEPENPKPFEPFTANFSINNLSPLDAVNVRVEINGMGNFEVIGLTNFLFRHAISGGGSPSSISFTLKSREERKENTITLSISYDYYPSADEYQGSRSGSQTLTVNLPLPDSFDLSTPNITVNKVTLDPAVPTLTEKFTAFFSFDNYSNIEARNVNVEVDGLNNFDIVDITNRKFLPNIVKNANTSLGFTLKSKENKEDNRIKLSFAYEHSAGTKATSELFINLPLDQASSGSSPFLKTKSYALQKTNDKEYLLKLILQNTGGQAAKDIVFTLDGGNAIFVLDGSNVNYFPQINAKQEIEIEYLLGINTDTDASHLPLNIKIEYKDANRNPVPASTETLGIAASQVGVDAAAGEPRVLISKYTLSEEKILAGNIVTLSLFIENTHSRPVHNIKVSLGILMVEGTGSNTTTSGGTVFSPVNSSNSFFIQEIPPKTVLEQSLDLLVDPNATAKTYVVPVTIEYEDGNAKSYEVEEMVNIPVTQESRLQVLSIEVPPEAFVGQPAFVSAEFVNVGKVDLGNFIVMMEGDFRKEGASYFVGNLGIGMSDYYQGIIYPEQEGTLEGELVFSYIDNNNREIRVAEPFQIEVMPMMEMEPFPEGEMPPGIKRPGGPGEGNSKKYIWLVIAVVIVAAAGGFFLRRRSLKKRNGEFFDA